MYDNFVVEGDKIATEIIFDSDLEIESIFALKSWLSFHISSLEKYQELIQVVNEKELSRISGLKTPNQVLVVCKKPVYSLDFNSINNNLTLFLDNIQNPGNMGSILRIADWFGIPYVFCSENSVELYNPKVIQASMGAFIRVKSVVVSFGGLREKLPDLPCLCTVLNGENVYSAQVPKKGILVLGNEGAGIAPEILAQATHKVSIPKDKKGGAESLNVAVAAGIVCAALKCK